MLLVRVRDPARCYAPKPCAVSRIARGPRITELVMGHEPKQYEPRTPPMQGIAAPETFGPAIAGGRGCRD